LVLALGISLISIAPSVNAVDCSTFDPSSIHALTFDVFAALMDSPDSLVTNVAAALPALSPSDVDTFVGKWLDAYGYYFGKTFNQTTQGPEPFTWVIHTSLVTILEGFGLNGTVPVDGPVFSTLMQAWSNLTPWPGTAETLALLQSKGILLAPLSNGDHNTLLRAVSTFLPQVNMTGPVFSSDYPVGVFKPLGPIYAQVAEAFGIDHVMHVAGSGIDGFGARSYGLFNTLLYDHADPGPQPCFVLSNITQLPAVLGF